MSGQERDPKIAELEKDVAVMKATISPLLRKIDESTTAMNELSGEIALLVQSNRHMEKLFDDVKADVKENRKDIIDLQKTNEVRKSSDSVILWGKRVVVVALVGALMSLIIIKG